MSGGNFAASLWDSALFRAELRNKALRMVEHPCAPCAWPTAKNRSCREPQEFFNSLLDQVFFNALITGSNFLKYALSPRSIHSKRTISVVTRRMPSAAMRSIAP